MAEIHLSVEDSAAAPCDESAKSRVLIWAPFGRDGLEIERVLTEAGMDALVCGNMPDVCAEIRRGAAAVVVTEESLADESRCQLSAVLGEQPAWSDLPVLIMASLSRGQDDGWRFVRALEQSSYVILLERPVYAVTLVSAVRAAVRSRQRQYEVRDELLARRKAEAELRQKQEWLTLAQEAGGVDVFDWNRHTERVLRQPRMKEVPEDSEGFPASTFEDWVERVHPDDLAWLRPALEEWLRSGSVERQWEYRFRGADGEYRWILSRARILCDEENEPVRVVGTNLDITDRKQAEKDLRAFNEKLEAEVARRAAVAERRAQDLRRMAAELSEAEHRERTRLATLLHDDLQQLLFAARLRLSALVELPPEEREPQLEKIDGLLDDCLRTSRNLTRELSPPVIQYGTVVELLQWLGEWFHDKYGLQVTVEVTDDPPPAPDHLRVFLFQAVRELLMNVVKHSGSQEAVIAVTCRIGYLVVQVEDGGEHCDVEALTKKLDRPEGFGLFNVQQRLEALGGQLQLHVTPRGGARLRIVVPLEEPASVQPMQTAFERAEMSSRVVNQSRNAGAPLRVVVADDHAVVREGFVALLNRQPDFEVVGEASDGQQAMQQTDAILPDVVMMDVEMPNVSGIEATRQIKSRQPQVVVVGLSLHQDESIARAMLDAGADAYVCKSVPAQDVLSAIRRACLPDGD